MSKRYTINELQKELDNLIRQGHGEQKVELDMSQLKLLNKNTGEYTEGNIKEAINQTKDYYGDYYDKMNFNDIILLEHVLMNFERILFVGEIGDDCQINR